MESLAKVNPRKQVKCLIIKLLTNYFVFEKEKSISIESGRDHIPASFRRWYQKFLQHLDC